MKSPLLNLTEEERSVIREKARIAREEKKLAGEGLRQDYADKNHHRELASKYGLRLPIAYAASTEVKYLKRTMKKVGADYKEYLESCGCATLKKLAEMNPKMTAAESVGLFLEWWDEKK